MSLIPVALGVVIASGGEPSFNIIGFSTCLLAVAGRALKSVVQVRQYAAMGMTEGMLVVVEAPGRIQPG